MTAFESLIRDRGELALALSIADVVFDRNARLPNQVFRAPQLTFGMVDYVEMNSADFAEVLSWVSELCADESIVVVSVEPSPDSVELRTGAVGNFAPGYFGAANIDAASIRTEFWSVLSFSGVIDSKASSLLLGKSLCIAGSSGLWGCWGEYDQGVAILGYPSSLGTFPEFAPPLVLAEQALEWFVGFMYGGEVAPEFSKKFLDCYG
jgi:hypothetical protein